MHTEPGTLIFDGVISGDLGYIRFEGRHGLTRGEMTMRAKHEAVAQFSRTPLKHPMSKLLLQFLLEEKGLLERITFVRNREFLPNTMLISELGSSRVSFELELGARQREEVSIVNGQLIRQTRRDRSLCINEPVEAIEYLKDFKGKLYVLFAFAGPTPSWYEAVCEQNPALPVRADAKESIEMMIDEIMREQIDLAIHAILLRDRIEQALCRRDRAEFHAAVPLYYEVLQRCLWEF